VNSDCTGFCPTGMTAWWVTVKCGVSDGTKDVFIPMKLGVFHVGKNSSETAKCQHVLVASLPNERRTCIWIITVYNLAEGNLRHLIPYLPDLTMSDYYLFPKLKEFMKGRKFADDKTAICSIPYHTKIDNSSTADFQLPETLDQCISLAGDHVEKWQNVIYIYISHG